MTEDQMRRMQTRMILHGLLGRTFSFTWPYLAPSQEKPVSRAAFILSRIVRERDANDGAGMSVRATWGVSRTGQIRKGV